MADIAGPLPESWRQYGLRKVLQVIFNALGVLYRGWACCKTSSRYFMDKNIGVRTDTGTPIVSALILRELARFVTGYPRQPGASEAAEHLPAVLIDLFR